MKNIQKNTRKLIKLAGFGLVSLTLLASCGEDKEAYNAWQDKYPHVPCSYDDFDKTKPRGNTCFEKIAKEYSSRLIRNVRNRHSKRIDMYSNDNYFDFAEKKLFKLYYEMEQITEAVIERKEHHNLVKEYLLLEKNKSKEKASKIRKKAHILAQSYYNDEDKYPALFKIRKKIKSFAAFVYLKDRKEATMYYPEYLIDNYQIKHLESCKDAKDIFVCLDKIKLQVKKKCDKENKGNALMQLSCANQNF